MKILLDLVDRLELRAKEAHEAGVEDLQIIWSVLASEIRLVLVRDEERRMAQQASPPEYTRFDPKRDLLKDSDLATIQRVGRDEENRSTTIDLGLFDTIINGYRWLHGQYTGGLRAMVELDRELSALRRSMTETASRRLSPDPSDPCRGNCSRGGDGPPCGKYGCQG